MSVKDKDYLGKFGAKGHSPVPSIFTGLFHLSPILSDFLTVFPDLVQFFIIAYDKGKDYILGIRACHETNLKHSRYIKYNWSVPEGSLSYFEFPVLL